VEILFMAQSDSVLAAAPSVSRETTEQRRRRGFFSADNPWLWVTPALVFLLSYSIFPLIYNLVISFHEWHTRKKIFEPVGLDYVAMVLIIELILGIIIAFLLDAQPWGYGLMQTVIMLPMVTAPSVAGMLFRLLEHSEFGAISWVFYGLGIISKDEPLMGGTGANALAGIMIVDIWQWTPFIVLIVLAGLKGLPHEVMEASQVDGANWWQRILWIKMPLLRGVLTIAILFRLVDLFKIFDYVTIMTAGGPGGKTETLSFYGYVNTFQQVNWGYGAAIGLTVMIVVWVFAFTYQKVFRIQW
jgi:multiple sugar transport system permease protein